MRACPFCGSHRVWPDMIDGSIDGTPATAFRIIGLWHCDERHDGMIKPIRWRAEEHV